VAFLDGATIVLARHRWEIPPPEDSPFFAIALAAMLPAAAAVLWAHVRAFGWRREGIHVEEPPWWVATLVLLGGGAALFFGGGAILDAVGWGNDVTYSIVVGASFSIPGACYVLWVEREYWRHPGSYWRDSQPEEWASAKRKDEQERRKAAARRRESDDAKAARAASRGLREGRRRGRIGRGDS
jgi:hypothetical protein